MHWRVLVKEKMEGAETIKYPIKIIVRTRSAIILENGDTQCPIVPLLKSKRMMITRAIRIMPAE